MFLGAWAQGQQPKFQAHNKVIRKVRQRRHWNPLFGYTGEDISKKLSVKSGKDGTGTPCLVT
jgi:hypothetical protein